MSEEPAKQCEEELSRVIKRLIDEGYDVCDILSGLCLANGMFTVFMYETNRVKHKNWARWKAFNARQTSQIMQRLKDLRAPSTNPENPVNPV